MTCPRLLPWLLLLALGGCLEHEELLVVDPHGGLEVTHTWRGDPPDLDGGAARLPGREEGWQLQRSTRIKEDGKPEDTLVARARFASAQALPARFGPADEPLAAAQLEVETSLEVVPQAGRVVYRFRRSYAPRTWGPYAFLQKRAFPEEVKALFKEAGDLEHMAAEKKRVLLEAVAGYERDKARHWADRALASAGGPGGEGDVGGRLAVRAAVDAVFQARVSLSELERLVRLPPDQLEAETRRLQAALEEAVVQAAAPALARDEARLSRLREQLRLLRRSFEVTEDLGDEAFVVRLTLPGRLIAHDADGVEGGALVWRFHGQDLRDRRHTLLAESVVESK